MFKVSEKTLGNVSNILKVDNKDTGMTSGALFVNFEHILYSILCYYC